MYRSTLFFVLFSFFVSHTLAQGDDPLTPYHDQQFRLIKKGRKFFSAYQKAYKEKTGELPKINLQEATLIGVDLRGMNLDNADFRESDLRGVQFGHNPAKKMVDGSIDDDQNSDPKAILASSLRNADFRGSDIGEHEKMVADFSLSNCEGANFSDTDLTGARFIKTNAKNAIFRETSLIGANFRMADLTNGDMTGADVERCIFDHTILIRTQMVDLNIDECIMKGVIFTEKQLKEFIEKQKKRQ
ncbi:MAG: pentapeptide repeat-containing protein [Saprospiraceae bacterium]|nr:pentapeptide repeat-containing protein [Saprospiraceae bacterium]